MSNTCQALALGRRDHFSFILKMFQTLTFKQQQKRNGKQHSSAKMHPPVYSAARLYLMVYLSEGYCSTNERIIRITSINTSITTTRHQVEHTCIVPGSTYLSYEAGPGPASARLVDPTRPFHGRWISAGAEMYVDYREKMQKPPR